MTKKELSQLYGLNREIDQLTAQVALQEQKLKNHNGESDRAALEESVAILHNLRERAALEYKRLMREIGEVEDSITRQVLMLRYVNGLSWRKVALCMGGDNTSDGVRMVAMRYIKSQKK